MLKITFFLLISICALEGKVTYAQSASLPPLTYLFKPGDGNYACFRIPALLTSSKHTLLAFAEARKDDCGDSGNIGLVLKRSTDGGKTWGSMQVVWSDSTNTCGNPVPIQDEATGKIWLVSSWNSGTDHEKEIRDQSSKYGRRVFVLSSDDDGKTWSTGRDITSTVKMPGWTWYATGPCHGLQISQGKYKGRLVVPINHMEVATGKNFAGIIYSDDHGANWKPGDNTPHDKANETTVAELSNGNLILNSRSGDKTSKYRLTAISNNGGQNWADMHIDSTLIEPICQGTLLNYNTPAKKAVLFFCNPASQAARSNLTLRVSTNEGKNWSAGVVVFPGPSAYSDITVNNNQVSCLYEAGTTKAYEGIAFKTITTAQLLDQ